ncbi:unnamed protein product, partial [Sphagnum compactum]
GSKKYPVRDPFFKMINRSLATFMNAMTGPDNTLYPFSSTNESDYRNLQSVYLDAVFRPNLKYLDFLQEGWRLEHSKLDDKNSELILKGVVYNEMKGAFSENSAVFGQNYFNKILPDHTYGYVSGGDPLDIPQLTHNDLLNFHQKYYHPSNARIFSYGTFNLSRTLEYVDQEYLKHVNPIDPSFSIVPNQKRWSETKYEHITCRFDNMGAPIERQHQIGIGYLMSDIRDVYEGFVIYVLAELLVKGPNSYFYKSLIEPNISGGYNQITGYDPQIKDTMFVVGLQDLSSDDFKKVQKIFNETIQEVLEKGFDKSHVESVLHNIELNIKHQTTKFGLGLLFNISGLWNHGTGSDLLRAMNVNETLNEFRRQLLADPRYLEKKVEQYFIKNTHQLILTMSPDKSYEQESSKAEQNLLQKKVCELTPTDKERIYKDGLALADFQKLQENTDILPCLKEKDIKKKLDQFSLEHCERRNVSTQICTTDTNGVLYFRAILDATCLTKEELLLLPLFASIADQFGTHDTDYRTFDKRIASKTAGLSFYVHVAEDIDDENLRYQVGLIVGSYCLNNNVEDMFEIFSELFNQFEPTDIERFEMLLQNYVSQLSCGIVDSGHLYAMQAASGLVSESAALKENLMGIAHLEFMKQLVVEKTPKEILDDIKEVADKLFKEATMKCAINLSENFKDEMLPKYDNFIRNVRYVSHEDDQRVIWHNSKFLPAAQKHNIMTIPVNYCAKALATVNYTHEDFAPLRVAARILSSKYLLPVVREQNGAYGAGARIGIDGIFNFFSYRDPNSIKTLNVFDDAYNWLHDFKSKIDKQTLFEAKLGVLQQLDVPIAPMDKGMDFFKYGITEEIFLEQRNNVLNVTVDDIMRVTE